MDFSLIKEQFDNYVFNNFDINDIDINRKYYHSLRVMEIADNLARYENFSETDIELANVIGLLHDYARFPQWTKYKTYSDLNSVEHGDLAVKLLFDNNEIEKFNINKDHYDVIYDAIKYHNKISYPLNMNKHNSLLCKLIRDADKLDIFYLFSTDKKLFLEDDVRLSDDVINSFYNYKLIDRRNVKSKNDTILLDLGMIFDLNFNYSFKYLMDNKLVDKMYERVVNKELFKEYFDFVKKYINERID